MYSIACVQAFSYAAISATVPSSPPASSLSECVSSTKLNKCPAPSDYL